METIMMIILIYAALRYSGILKFIKIKNRKLRLKSNSSSEIFDQWFIEAKAFYMRIYNAVPCVAYIGNVDTKKIFELINADKYGKVHEVYQRIYHYWDGDKILFDKTIFILQNKVMVKLCEEWLEIYFGTNQYDIASKMLNEFKKIKAPQKEKDYEINIISLNNNSIELKTLAIKPTQLDINLYYNDDFKAINALIKERLGKENDKGIILLHGLPGTGKTTYLRYLIGNLKKKVNVCVSGGCR